MLLYNIFIERKAEKYFNKLPKEIQKRVFSAILSFKHNSKPMGVRKIIGQNNYYRIRIGEYRLIYEIMEEKKEVRIFIIRHRKDAYKSF